MFPSCVEISFPHSSIFKFRFQEGSVRPHGKTKLGFLPLPTAEASVLEAVLRSLESFRRLIRALAMAWH